MDVDERLKLNDTKIIGIDPGTSDLIYAVTSPKISSLDNIENIKCKKNSQDYSLSHYRISNAKRKKLLKSTERKKEKKKYKRNLNIFINKKSHSLVKAETLLGEKDNINVDYLSRKYYLLDALLEALKYNNIIPSYQ